MLVLKKVKTKYKDRGFTITDYHGDNEFKHHTCATNDHIGDIKKFIQKIMERDRYGCHSITYKKFTKLMKRYLVQDMITCLNMFPSKIGISINLGPSSIILGFPNTDYNKPKITFGAYEQVCIGTTNSKT